MADENLYGYCDNEPTEANDPTGMQAHGKFAIEMTTAPGAGAAGTAAAHTGWLVTRAKITWVPAFYYEPNPEPSEPRLPPKEAAYECGQVRLFQIAYQQEIIAGGLLALDS